MRRVIVLDAGPLGMVAHPRHNPEIKKWLQHQLHTGSFVAISEITDYEVRRELLRANKSTSIQRLDFLKTNLLYLPLSTAIMLQAASLWAQVRNQGLPTAANAALDADVILAAQVIIQQAQGDSVVVATTNIRHIERLVPAQLWQDIT